jgi:ABC-type transporter MlaC component
VGFLVRGLLAIVGLSVALAAQASPEEDILATYQPMLASFNTALAEDAALFKDSPDDYWSFFQEVVLPLWSRQASLKGLAGDEKVAALLPQQQAALNDILDRTVQRYAFEVLESYSGQSFVLNKVVIDSDNTDQAVLDITAQWPNFPDLDIELMLVNEAGTWRFYNIRYGWFSYIGTKKWAYRRGLVPKRFEAFAAHLEAKNRRHFAAMCEPQILRGSDICSDWLARMSVR